jgi:fumarate hydratase class II
MNEVICHRANEIDTDLIIHPNDHVNMSQSTNDIFPTAIQITLVETATNNLIPAINKLDKALARLQRSASGIVKLGRTHLQDALPLLYSQEISA